MLTWYGIEIISSDPDSSQHPEGHFTRSGHSAASAAAALVNSTDSAGELVFPTSTPSSYQD